MDSKNMTVQLNKNKQKHPFVIKYNFITIKKTTIKKPSVVQNRHIQLYLSKIVFQRLLLCFGLNFLVNINKVMPIVLVPHKEGVSSLPFGQSGRPSHSRVRDIQNKLLHPYSPSRDAHEPVTEAMFR